ncbi:DUF1343 domain-containing protein [bacterium]|nr:MAG: DUF1343 domain-containing protein [bacterium]QQR61613.1 MAG: DUF1343 domain-containing protein [bacterium]
MKPSIIHFLATALTTFSVTISTANHFHYGIESVNQKLIKKMCSKTDPRIGLVTNQTGIVHNGVKSVDFLKTQGITVSVIFAPEHGYWGVVPAGKDVASTVKPNLGIPVVSLYAHGAGKKITAQQMDLVDILIFDIQDVGMRHFTYISLLYKVMEAAKTFDKPLIVCDRPNPLGGLMEGPLVEPSLISFISIAPVPLRHGMTIGELALYFNRYQMNNSVSLHVAKMKKYKRAPLESLHAPLSPNIKTIESVRGYSFLGLVGEIAPFDVGISSDTPFEILGLQTSEPQATLFLENIKKEFDKVGLASSMISYLAERNGKTYTGLKFDFSKPTPVSTIQSLIYIIQKAVEAKLKISFSASFDKAFGNSLLKKQYESVSIASFALLQEPLAIFYKKAKATFLYKPYPFIKTLN